MNWLLRCVLLSGCLLVLPAGLKGEASNSAVGYFLPKLDLEFVGEEPDLEGKVILLEFWATWCGPCIENIPRLNRYQKLFQGQGFEVVGVSHESFGTVKRFVEKNDMRYRVAVDEKAVLNEAFGVTAIPHAVLVSAAGRVVWDGHPGDLETKMIMTRITSREVDMEVDRLFRVVFGQAQKWVISNGEFMPFGAASGADEKVYFVGAEYGMEKPPAEDRTGDIMTVLKQGTEEKLMSTTAYACCVPFKEKGSKYKEAMEVTVEHQSGSATKFVIPFKVRKNGKLLLGSMDVSAAEPELFGSVKQAE